MKAHFALFILAVTISARGAAQCCSPGTPIAGSANLGILDKGKSRFTGFFRHSFSEGYYDGFRRTDYAFIKNAGFDFAGIILAHGITEKVTFEAEAGYFFSKYQVYNLSREYRLSGLGLSSGVFSLKRNFYKNAEKEWEITLGTGIKFPFSRSLKEAGGVALPQDLQPSSGAFGAVLHTFISKGYTCKGARIFLINRTEINGSNPEGYSYGNTSITSFFYSKELSKNFTGLLQARHEIRLKDQRQGDKIAYSGGNQVFLSPQLSYTFKNGLNLSGTYDIPALQFMNGKQIGNKYSASVIMIKDF
jgi:hypothetical protein